MALTLKFSAVVDDYKAGQLLLKDTTGAYNVSTNPTGYGSANNFEVPTIALMRYKAWTDTAWIDTLLSTGQETALQATDGLVVIPEDLGVVAEVFPDGVDQLNYIPLNDSGITATFTNGSKIVTLPGGFDPADYGSPLFAFISAGDLGEALEVDWNSTNDEDQVTLKTAYSGTTATLELFFGPVYDLKILINKAGEACIATTLGASSVIDCGCNNTAPKVNQMIQWRFVADVLFECADYTGAHNTLVQLNQICNSNALFCAV
jgi:hypothetical protein